MRILLAVDGSSCSEAAARSVARRPWPQGTTVRVLSVYEGMVLVAMPEMGAAPADLWERVAEETRDRAREAAERIASLLREAETASTVETRVLEGHPKQVILQEAERWGADLIVVGSHGHRGLSRLWLGSVSQAVATQARCSVEIVREPDTD